MKLTVSRSDFLRALSSARGAVEAGDLPTSDSVLVAATERGLAVTATDLTMQVTETVTVDVDQPDVFTVPLSPLYRVIRRIPDAANIVVEHVDSTLSLRAGRLKTTLPTLSIDSFPVIGSDAKFDCNFNVVGLAAAIETVAHAINTDDYRAYLRGVFLHTGGLVATNGHSVALHDAALGGPGVIVPRKTMVEVGRLAEDKEIAIDVSANLIRFRFGTTTVVSRLIDGKFPDYARVVPLGNDRVVECDRQEMMGAVGRVGASNEKGHAMHVSLSDGVVILSMSDRESGIVATEDVHCDYYDDPVTLGLNSRYLLSALEHLEGARCTIAVADDRTPVLLRGEGSTVQVVMAMRLEG